MAGFADLGAQLVQDLRYARRSLAASPGFAMTAILTIALGVGLNAGIFSVLNAVAFRGIPAAQPDLLVAIDQVVGSGSRCGPLPSARFAASSPASARQACSRAFSSASARSTLTR